MNLLLDYLRARAWLLALTVCAMALAYFLFQRPIIYQAFPYLSSDGVIETISSFGRHFEENAAFLPILFALFAIWFRSSTAIWLLAAATLSNSSVIFSVLQGWADGRVVWDAPQIFLRAALPLVAIFLCAMALNERGSFAVAQDAPSNKDRRLRYAVIVASGVALAASLYVDPTSGRDDGTITNLVRLKLIKQQELPVLLLAFIAAFFNTRAAALMHGLAVLYLFDDVHQNLQHLLRHGQHFLNGGEELICAAASAIALVCAVFFVLRNHANVENT